MAFKNSYRDIDPANVFDSLSMIIKRIRDPEWLTGSLVGWRNFNEDKYKLACEIYTPLFCSCELSI